MQFTKCTLLVLAVLFAMFSASSVFSADNDPVTVTSILKAAKCPLTKEQQKTIADIEPGENMRELWQNIYGMFDEKQMKALKDEREVVRKESERIKKLSIDIAAQAAKLGKDMEVFNETQRDLLDIQETKRIAIYGGTRAIRVTMFKDNSLVKDAYSKEIVEIYNSADEIARYIKLGYRVLK